MRLLFYLFLVYICVMILYSCEQTAKQERTIQDSVTALAGTTPR